MTEAVTDGRRASLRLFGGPALEVDGRLVKLSSYQASLLLVVYGHGPEGVSRSKVIDLLWDEHDGPKQRHRLSQLLYAINKKAGVEVIAGLSMDRLGSCDEEVACDLAAFRKDLECGRLHEASDVLDSPFATLVDPPPTHEFDRWASSVPVMLRGKLVQRVRSLASQTRRDQDWPALAIAAEVALRFDPEDQSALRDLMEALSMTGRPREALAAYDAQLARNNGGHDDTSWIDSETRALRESITRSVRERPFGYRTMAAATADARLCGRDDELADILAGITKGAPSGLSMHLLSGHAGMGKTRLLSEVLQRARLYEFEILTASCSELEQAIPLNAILDGLKSEQVGDALRGLDDPWRAVMLSLLPNFLDEDEPAPQPPYVRPGSVPRRLYEAVLRVFAELTAERPAILAIDNFQWADETSVSVLEFITRRWSGGSLLVLLSYRPVTAHPDTAAGRFIRTQESDRTVRRTVLDDLSRRASLELVAELTKDRPLDDAMEEELALLGCGSPFFLIELTQEHLAGRLKRQGSGDIAALPMSVKEIITERLRALRPVALELLSVLAVFGREMRIESLFTLMDQSREDLVGPIEELERLRLVATSATHLGVRHDLIQFTVYSELSPVRRALLHRRIAEHLMEDDEKAADDLAIHFDRAGDSEQALKYALVAARRAEESGAVSEAINYLTIARHNAENDPRDHEILGRLAHLHYLHRSGPEAAALLELAAKRYREIGELKKALTAEVERIDFLGRESSLNVRDLLQELAEARTTAARAGCWEVLARSLDVTAIMLEQAGRRDGIARVMGEARRVAASGVPRAECLASCTLAFQLLHGDPEEGLRYSRRSVQLCKANGFEDLLFVSHVRLVTGLVAHGLLETDEGRVAIQAAELLAERSGDVHHKFLLLMNLGVWHLDIGELDRARTRIMDAKALMSGVGSNYDRILLAFNMGELALLERDLCSARLHFETGGELLSRSPNERFSWIREAGPGLVALYEGDLGEADIREGRLTPFPDEWSIDPTLPVLFKARQLERRGKEAQALELISTVARSVRNRFVLYWMRLALEEIQRRGRTQKAKALNLAREVRGVAANLNLDQRIAEIDRLIERID